MYAYVGNDPMNATDPMGLSDCRNASDCEKSGNRKSDTTRISNEDGSVTVARMGSVQVGDKTIEVTKASVNLEPQASLGGEAASLTEDMENSLLNVSEDVGTTVNVYSGVRTQEQNIVVGGAPSSQHLAQNGGAADIGIPGMSGSETAQTTFNSHEFSRVNDYQDGRVHVDNKPTTSSGFYRRWKPVLMARPRMRPTPPPRP